MVCQGLPLQQCMTAPRTQAYCDTQLRVVFDGDAVLFCEEPEHGTKDHGPDKCFQHEAIADNKPLVR